MKVKVILVLILLPLLLSCSSKDLPPEPGNPGETKSTGLAGKAFSAGLADLGYSTPKFSISSDILTTKEPLSVSANADYVWKYYYVAVDGTWIKKELQGEAVGSSNWLRSSGNANLITDQLKEGDNYVTLYSCNKVTSERTLTGQALSTGNWDCNDNKWQIHIFKIQLEEDLPFEPELPPGGILGPQCGSNQECPSDNVCTNGKCVSKTSLCQPKTVTPSSASAVLGAGSWAGDLSGALEYFSLVDLARFEWLLVDVSLPRTVEIMNQLLEINPELKFMVRLWPVNNLNPYGLQQNTAIFLDWRYDTNVKTEVEKRLRDQIKTLALGISKPQNIIGFNFLEELPAWWGASMLTCQNANLPKWECYRTELEGEGVTLPTSSIPVQCAGPLGTSTISSGCNAEFKDWIGQAAAESIREVHSIIRDQLVQEGWGNKLILFVPHGSYDPKDVDLVQLDKSYVVNPPGFDSVLGYGFTDIIGTGPGLADGLMVNTVTEKHFFTGKNYKKLRYMDFVDTYNWPFFTALTHAGFQRAISWQEALTQANVVHPNNLGYFFFQDAGSAGCDPHGGVNELYERNKLEDPALMAKIKYAPDPITDYGQCEPKEWFTLYTSLPLHNRLFAAMENIGENIVEKSFPLKTEVNIQQKGSMTQVVVLVQNQKKVSYYETPNEAVAEQVTVTIKLPDETTQPPLNLGNILPGEVKEAKWLVNSFTVNSQNPIEVLATSSDTAESCRKIGENDLFSSSEHQIGGSGEKWHESGYNLQSVYKPKIIMEAIANTVKEPSLTDGVNTIKLNEGLRRGYGIEIDSNAQGTYFPTNMISDPTNNLLATTSCYQPGGDANCYKSFSEKYSVAGMNIPGVVLEQQTDYKVEICGKKQGSAQSQVVVYGDSNQCYKTMLVSKFTDAWGCYNEIINVNDFTCPGAVGGELKLDRILLYRLNNADTIWYGPVSLKPIIPPGQESVNPALIIGNNLEIQPDTFTMITYSESPDELNLDFSPIRKIKIRLE
jgi:hypothetical protein